MTCSLQAPARMAPPIFLHSVLTYASQTYTLYSGLNEPYTGKLNDGSAVSGIVYLRHSIALIH